MPSTENFDNFSTEPFDSFTERARKVLSLAQEEAQYFQHNSIGTEHLLVGLVHEGDGVAAKVLNHLGITLERVRSEIETMIGRGQTVDSDRISLSPEARQAIELAIEEARNQNHRYVGTEHLLLGLIRQNDAIAVRILESLGASPGKLRLQTLQIITTSSSSISAPARPTPPPVTPTAAKSQRFSKFSERARKVLSLAQEEAQRFQHNYIGTEHLFLGLIRENEGVAARILHDMGLELENIRREIEAIIQHGNSIVLGEIGLTPRAKKTIELAVDESIRLNHHYIGTEHLLLGLVREGQGIAAQVMAKHGVTLEEVRTRVIQMLSESGTTSQSNTTSTEAHQPDPNLSSTPGEERKTSWEEQYLSKLSEQGRKVLDLSQEEAQRFQHNYIGTEHLLLGLVRQEDSVATQVLTRLGVELLKIRSAVEFIIGRGDRIVLGKIGLTPRAKKVVQLAVDEAKRLNHPIVNPEHILLGLVREGEGIGAGVLESLGVRLPQVRQQILAVLNGDETTPQGTPADSGLHSIRFSPQPAFTHDYQLTDDAKTALALAEGEARLLQHGSIGPEHVLLGLVHEGQHNASRVLQSFNIDLERARSVVESQVGQGQHTSPGSLPLTPLALAYLHLAADEAQKLGHHELRSEHLLLGITRETQGIIATLLELLGTTIEAVRTKTFEVIQRDNK